MYSTFYGSHIIRLFKRLHHSIAYHAALSLAAETTVHQCASNARQSPAATAAEMCWCKDTAQHSHDLNFSHYSHLLIPLASQMHDSPDVMQT